MSTRFNARHVLKDPILRKHVYIVKPPVLANCTTLSLASCLAGLGRYLHAESAEPFPANKAQSWTTLRSDIAGQIGCCMGSNRTTARYVVTSTCDGQCCMQLNAKFCSVVRSHCKSWTVAARSLAYSCLFRRNCTAAATPSSNKTQQQH